MHAKPMIALQARQLGDPPEEKAEYVRSMFSGIASRYDLLNDLMSFGRHRAWRRQAVRQLNLKPGDTAIDICTGTGDFARDLATAVGVNGLVAASDFCRPMIEAGYQRPVKSGSSPIGFAEGDAMRLPYRSNSADSVTVGFGIRNVADVDRAITEMTRIARSGGRVLILEFTQPRSPILGPIVRMFETRVLPLLGGLLSSREAYTYLPKSIEGFHSREQLADSMIRAGLVNVSITELNLGSVCIHLGTKP